MCIDCFTPEMLLYTSRERGKYAEHAGGAAKVPTFEYHAIRTDDQEEKSFVGGVVVARTRLEAKEKLRQQGLKATMLKRARGLIGLLRWLDADIR